jgi:hypothetical protein
MEVTVTSSEEGNERGRALGNLHYDLPVTLKYGKKEKQDRWCEDHDQPIRPLHSKMLLSAHLVSRD